MNQTQKTAEYQHTSVLLAESIKMLEPAPGGVFIDCTLGGGGHTAALLDRVMPSGKVLAFDRDLVAIKNASIRFAKAVSEGRLILKHAVFSDIFSVVQQLGLIGRVDGILADIGVSSHHLDVAERGFSFMADGPLDMRMDQSVGKSAAEFLAAATETEIADVIYKFGEEPKARIIAKIICEQRSKAPLATTKSLADLISAKIFWKKESRKHPATRTFQALRIYVNQELMELEKLLADGCRVLRVGGVLAVITFHSLEDRMVKNVFKQLAGRSPEDRPPRDIVLTANELAQQSKARAEIIPPFPAIASDQEVQDNPRSRSAKLRAIRLTKECL